MHIIPPYRTHTLDMEPENEKEKERVLNGNMRRIQSTLPMAARAIFLEFHFPFIEPIKFMLLFSY